MNGPRQLLLKVLVHNEGGIWKAVLLEVVIPGEGQAPQQHGIPLIPSTTPGSSASNYAQTPGPGVMVADAGKGASPAIRENKRCLF